MLEVKHLTRQYGSHVAVQDLSFSLDKGQVVGFLGRNGAGKSTTMNMLTGYLTPTSGEILWQGEDVRRLGPAYYSEIGYLPEIPPLYPELTVEEMLTYVCGLKKVRIRCRKAHIAECCELARITHVRRTRIGSLSKGYRQRVGLAAALIGNPQLLILDEPTVGLDPEQIVLIRELIRELGKEHAVLLSSHILSEIEDVCTSLLVIRKGKLAAQGTIGEIAAMAHPDVFRLRLRVRGADVLAALQNIGQVRTVEPLPARELGCLEYLLTADGDVSQQVQDAVHRSGAVLRMLHPMDVELEDIFLNLTGEEAAPC